MFQTKYYDFPQKTVTCNATSQITTRQQIQSKIDFEPTESDNGSFWKGTRPISWHWLEKILDEVVVVVVVALTVEYL